MGGRAPRSLWAVELLMLFCGLVAMPARGDIQPLSDKEKNSIVAEVRNAQACSEISAEEFARNHDKRAIPVLIGILEGEEAPLAKGTAAMYLGKMHAEEAVQPIVENVIEKMPEVMTPEECYSVVGSILALGFIGSDRALDYLKEMMTLTYWEKRKLTPRVPDLPRHEKSARRLFRSMAVNAFGHSMKPRALAELRNRDSLPKDLPQSCYDGALKEAERRLAAGARPGEYAPLREELSANTVIRTP